MTTEPKQKTHLQINECENGFVVYVHNADYPNGTHFIARNKVELIELVARTAPDNASKLN